MKIFTTFAVSLLFSITAVAQSDNGKKIIGCWQLDRMEFVVAIPDAEDLQAESKGRIVCFDKDGQYKTSKTKNETPITVGSYKVSADGRTIDQSEENNVNVKNAPGTITLLDDKNLTIAVEEVILHFIKAN